MTIFVLLAGIVIAGMVFAATLWSLAQIVRQKGQLRWAYVIVLIATLAAMTALSLESFGLVTFTVAILCATAVFAMYADTGWNRILPLFQFVFGLALFMGLPFAGG